MHTAVTHGDPANLLRRLLIAVLIIAMAGTLTELLLLEHTESRTQLIPLFALTAGILASLATIWRPRRATVLLLRLLMLSFIMTGIVGLYMHYRGNVEFELEMYPGLAGMELFRKAITGATPALAPGVMIQFGLFGLIYTWRHPACAR